MTLEELLGAGPVALTEEHDCDAHTVAVQVAFTPGLVMNAGTPDIIADLLRVLAVRAGGRCAIRGADNAHFRNAGMTFHFTSETDRGTFRMLCRRYIKGRSFRALAFTDL